MEAEITSVAGKRDKGKEEEEKKEKKKMKEKNKLILCFIHGFKGDDNTFGTFPAHLHALVSHALPHLDIDIIIYPQFETRGVLQDCVARFRDWLQNKVVDLEVELGTSSPVIDPSVRTVLVGHSMGGIVAVDTLLEIISDPPITQEHQEAGTDPEKLSRTFIFPYIQGILALDTPYLGISPGVVAHGAKGHYNTASTAFTQLSGMMAGGWRGAKADKTGPAGDSIPRGLLTAPAQPSLGRGNGGISSTNTGKVQEDVGDAAAIPAWQRWGKLAMYAGAAGAVAAGGAAAYLKRDQITQGWTWVGSHLEFVGCLVRGEELKTRLDRVVDLHKRGVGFVDLYTVLGRRAFCAKSATATAAESASNNNAGGGPTYLALVASQERSFINVPKTKFNRTFFHPQINDAATDETWAHMSMFFPKENPGFYDMAEQAKSFVVEWVEKDWSSSYPSSSSSSSNVPVLDDDITL